MLMKFILSSISVEGSSPFRRLAALAKWSNVCLLACRFAQSSKLTPISPPGIVASSAAIHKSHRLISRYNDIFAN